MSMPVMRLLMFLLRSWFQPSRQLQVFRTLKAMRRISPELHRDLGLREGNLRAAAEEAVDATRARRQRQDAAELAAILAAIADARADSRGLRLDH